MEPDRSLPYSYQFVTLPKPCAMIRNIRVSYGKRMLATAQYPTGVTLCRLSVAALFSMFATTSIMEDTFLQPQVVDAENFSSTQNKN